MRHLVSSSFEILVDRLRGGQVQKIQESFDPSFLEIQESELAFHVPVVVKGEAYLTESELILHLNATTRASMPCAICNKMIDKELKITGFYHAQPLDEIKGAIFDFREALREALLIEVPRTIECNGGKCPERATIAPFLRPEARVEKTTYFPFKDLE